MVDSSEEGIETVFAASKTDHLPFHRDTAFLHKPTTTQKTLRFTKQLWFCLVSHTPHAQLADFYLYAINKK